MTTSSASDRIRFGILGCGRIVERGLIVGLRDSTCGVLHALASERPGVAAEWAQKHGVPRAYSSYDELLADPDVDAVYIPCVGDLHHRWTIAAAKKGKHVLCEKPLARSVAEAEEMVAACDQAGVILMEAFMWRHHPRVAKARRLLAEGAIGDLRLINVNFSFNIDRSDWRMDPHKAGGALWDIGCYGVNCARLFAGAEPTEIYARAHWADTGIDMTMQLALRFPGDVLANIDCSFEAPFRCRAELVGTGGRLLLPQAFLPPDDSLLHMQRIADQGLTSEDICIAGANQYGCQVDAFCDSIRSGKLQDPAENGLANMRVIEQALRVAQANAHPVESGRRQSAE